MITVFQPLLCLKMMIDVIIHFHANTSPCTNCEIHHTALAQILSYVGCAIYRNGQEIYNIMLPCQEFMDTLM
jgi:hypothetical protein